MRVYTANFDVFKHANLWISTDDNSEKKVEDEGFFLLLEDGKFLLTEDVLKIELSLLIQA